MTKLPIPPPIPTPPPKQQLASLDEGFVGRIEAARKCCCSPQTIDIAIKHKQLPAYRFRRRILIKKSDLLKLIEAHKVEVKP